MVKQVKTYDRIEIYEGKDVRMDRRGNQRVTTPRPNVAVGAAIGLLAAVALAWLQVYQTGAVALPEDLPILIATFSTPVAAVFAYLAPKWDKVVRTLIVHGVVLALVVVLALILHEPITQPVIVQLISGALQLAATGYVNNELNEAA